MKTRTRAAAVLATLSASAIALVAVPAAQANVLSLLPGSCTGETYSQTFAQFGDANWYTAVPGGGFEAGTLPWTATGGAAPVAGNETFKVGGASDSRSLGLPAGSSATSPAVCASIDKPTLRFFARNGGSAGSRLNVDVLYPGLLGAVHTARIGSISAGGAWSPTGSQQLTVTNLLATLSLSRTAIAFRFSPADGSGQWTIDDVYVDPKMRG
jgi:hypothetical protein